MDYYLLIGGLKKGPFGFEELLGQFKTSVFLWVKYLTILM